MPDPARISHVTPAGGWTGEAADMVVLDYDGRHRRRIVLTGVSGARYLLDLAGAAHLKDGDGLELPTGGVVQVVAKAEPLLDVTAAAAPELIRLAWHIGNRHVAAQIEDGRILIRRDHVIAHLLEQQGGRVREVEAPFDPVGGAYNEHSHAH